MGGQRANISLDGLDARQEVRVGHDGRPSGDILHILTGLRRLARDGRRRTCAVELVSGCIFTTVATDVCPAVKQRPRSVDVPIIRIGCVAWSRIARLYRSVSCACLCRPATPRLHSPLPARRTRRRMDFPPRLSMDSRRRSSAALRRTDCRRSRSIGCSCSCRPPDCALPFMMLGCDMRKVPPALSRSGWCARVRWCVEVDSGWSRAVIGAWA